MGVNPDAQSTGVVPARSLRRAHGFVWKAGGGRGVNHGHAGFTAALVAATPLAIFMPPFAHLPRGAAAP